MPTMKVSTSDHTAAKPCAVSTEATSFASIQVKKCERSHVAFRFATLTINVVSRSLLTTMTAVAGVRLSPAFVCLSARYLKTDAAMITIKLDTP